MAKYDNIKFTAPETVKNNYRRGLEKHEEGLSGDGLESGTVEIAKDIVAGESITPEWARKGNRWWGRNERFLDEEPDSPAYVAALLWGGSAGKDWFESLVSQMDEADKKDTASNKIAKKDGQWCVFGESGRDMGCYDTESEAKERLSQIERFSGNQRFVTVTNRVNNSKIRVEKYRGDDIIVVPSYMHPADIVMNGIMYPEEESRVAAPMFSGVPVPFGHPVDEDGNFVSASSEIGANYYNFGAFNGNASYDEKSKRIFAEVRINKRKAQESEEGRRVLEAIEKGEPISTSTGLFLDIEELEQPAVNSMGQEYSMVARNLIPDHNAILLDEAPAASVDTGTGMMVNRDGKQVEYAGNLDDSMQELESELYRAVHEEFSDPENLDHAYVADWNHEELVYIVSGDSYRIGWMHTDDGEIQFVGESQPVKRRTLWEAVKNLFARSGQTSYNQSQRGRGGRVLDTLNRGDEMALRQKLIDKLKANKVELDYEKVTDEQLLEAVDNLTATNKADKEPEEPKGEVEANDAVVSAINSALKPLTDKVDALEAKLNAEKETELAEMRKKLNEEGDYEEGEVDDMGEKAVRAAYKRLKGNSEQAPAWHVGGQTAFNSKQPEGCTSLDLPDVEVE